MFFRISIFTHIKDFSQRCNWRPDQAQKRPTYTQNDLQTYKRDQYTNTNPAFWMQHSTNLSSKETYIHTKESCKHRKEIYTQTPLFGCSILWCPAYQSGHFLFDWSLSAAVVSFKSLFHKSTTTQTQPAPSEGSILCCGGSLSGRCLFYTSLSTLSFRTSRSLRSLVNNTHNRVFGHSILCRTAHQSGCRTLRVHGNRGLRCDAAVYLENFRLCGVWQSFPQHLACC